MKVKTLHTVGLPKDVSLAPGLVVELRDEIAQELIEKAAVELTREDLTFDVKTGKAISPKVEPKAEPKAVVLDPQQKLGEGQ